MALSVNIWKGIPRPIRIVSADGVEDEPSTGVPPGATLYRTDTLEGKVWNGSAWVASVGGAQGPAGPAGPAGADGAPGADGAQGPQGIQGIQGTQGPAGVDGASGSPGADGSNGLGFSAMVKLAADPPAFTATALADVTGLSFAVLANRSYTFQFWIRFSSAATTTGAQFAVNAPANSYIVYRTETSLTAAAAGAPTVRTARAVNIGTASASSDSIGGNLLCLVQGMVRPSADGTLIVRCGTEVAASGITVRSGSCGVLYDFGA